MKSLSPAPLESDPVLPLRIAHDISGWMANHDVGQRRYAKSSVGQTRFVAYPWVGVHDCRWVLAVVRCGSVDIPEDVDMVPSSSGAFRQVNGTV